MKTLHLHIGFPKTATTSIQHTLHDNQDLLNKYDFGLFLKRFDGLIEGYTKGQVVWVYHNTPIYMDHCFNGVQGYQVGEIIEKPLLGVFLSQVPQSNVIFSSEYLAHVSAHEIQGLYDEVKKYFSQIYVYVYIRRQDRFAVSLSQQEAKFYDKKSKGMKSLRLDRKPENYNEIIGRWAQSFGKENIRIRIFEKDRLVENDAVKDFFHALGLAHITENLTIAHENESLGFERTKIGHLLNSSTLNQGLQDYIRIRADNSGKCLPSRDVAEYFYSQIRETNVMLNKEFHISDLYEACFNDDFSDYPEQPGDEWTEETANKAIANIFVSVKGLMDNVAYQLTDHFTTQHAQELEQYKNKIVQYQEEVEQYKNEIATITGEYRKLLKQIKK